MARETPPGGSREQIVLGFTEQGPGALAGITTLRNIAATIFYALPDLGTGRNPSWDAIGYPGPGARRRRTGRWPLDARRPDEDVMTIEADVCVVGSGAGGGVIAGTLAEAGKQVCVVEMGGYFNEADFNGLEAWGYQNLYLRGGPMSTAEGQVSIQAGSSLGGGTVINWTNCLRTIPWVREQWAREHGLEGLDGPEFDAHLDAVWERLGVTDECSELNGPHQRLQEGCESLGWDFKLITRNVDPARHDPNLAGYVGFGDVTGSKQSTQLTYLADAHARGADLVVNCRRRADPGRGRPRGRSRGHLHRARRHGRPRRRPRAAGRGRLRLARVAGAAAALGHRRAGGRRLPAPAPGRSALRQLRRAAGRLVGRAADGALARVRRGAGGLRLPARGRAPRGRHQRRGDALALGAPAQGGHGELPQDRRADLPDPRPRPRAGGRRRGGERGSDVPADRRARRRQLPRRARGRRQGPRGRGGRPDRRPEPQALEWSRGEEFGAFLAALGEASLAPFEHAVFSAHQMGSCRMGSDPATSVANPWGELHDTPGVWIGDASAFPTASGTNPMVTIMALAHRTAGAIAAA